MNFEDFNLEKIRNELVRIEDTLIFGLIERSQFSVNSPIYAKNEFKELNGSFLDFFLFEMESAHSKVRRYTSPDEYPFSKNLPAPVIEPMKFPSVLAPNSIDYNPKIKDLYENEIVKMICKSGDDKNYGSAAFKDVEVLQALSRRIHFGKFVAEAKFNDRKLHEEYKRLIKLQDGDGIMELLTNKAVEDKLLQRLKKKARIYGQEIDLDDGSHDKDLRLNPETIAMLYEKFIIPMTKEVEVEYLLRRLDTDFMPDVSYQS